MGRLDKDEQVTLVGTVVGRTTGVVDRAVYIDATLEFDGLETAVEHREPAFDIATDDHGQLAVELARNPFIEPEHDVAGSWEVLEQHPVRPTGPYQPSQRGRLRGQWIVPGEAIAIRAYVKEHSFVPDTGTHREAPERRLSRVRAFAVGTGESRAEAEKRLGRAIVKRERELDQRSRPQPRRNPKALRSFAYAGACAIVGIVAIAMALLARSGTLGLGLLAGYLAIQFAWNGTVTERFPRGASVKTVEGVDNVTTPGTLLGLTFVIGMPVAIVLWFVADSGGQRDGALAGIVLLLGFVHMIYIVRALTTRPVNASGLVELPSNAWARRALLAGILAVWVTAFIVAIPNMQGSPP